MKNFLRFIVACVLVTPACQSQQLARLLRFPHVQGNKIAFVHGGDIWVCTLENPLARRLTSYDEGFEVMPRISPDGKWVAFSGEYNGSRQIYLVPWQGGVPKQLTFYPDVGPMPPRGGFDNLPYDWNRDSTQILIRSNRTPYGQRVGRYFLVDINGSGLPQPLAIPEGGSVSFAPDGKHLAYNIISREWRTWKRYKAGRSQDVWTFDLSTNKALRRTSYVGTDSHPLWVGKKIYFTSDRSGTLNLWCHALETGDEYPVTQYEDFDVLFPSRGQGGVIFEHGGYLHLMDATTESVKQLPIVLADDKPWTRSIWKNGAKRFGSFDLSPKGKSVVVEFRGDLFTAPAKKGEVRPLRLAKNRRERDPSWSPDGAYLAYVAEAGDNYELFLYDRAKKEERQLTKRSPAWILDYVFSPDGRLIAYTDKSATLRMIELSSGKVKTLDVGQERGIRQVAWSHDSSHLTYVKNDRNGLSSVWVVNLTDSHPQRVTSTKFSDSSPAFGPDGQYLYFVSSRDFDYSDRNFDSRIYALVLQQDGVSPLPYSADEEAIPGMAAVEESESEDSQKANDKEVMRIDFSGIAQRIVVLPMSAGRFFGLTALKDGLLYSDGDGLKRFHYKSQKPEIILKGVRGYALSADGKKLAYRYGGNLSVDSVVPGRKVGKNSLSLAGLRVKVNPVQEWQQMFLDAWRITRDWFYDPQMHGVDWLAMRKKYEPLLPHLSHRSDLDYLLGELVGELNVGHAYVQSGELPAVERSQAGCLGCEFEVEGGRYRITKIFASENWTSAGRNPISELGVKASVGEYLLAIDDAQVTASDNLYRYLDGKVGQRTKITLAKTASGEGAHDEYVRPIKNEVRLRYLDWVANNTRLVDEMSGGRIGYIHVPNTAVEGHRRFYEGMFALARSKDAFIIDDRYNGGGFIPDRMAQDLVAKPLNYWSTRNAELYPTPTRAFNGPTVMLINGYSSSGGDAFPYYYRKLEGGILIGAKTWGGLVGISFEPGLVDGGRIRVPSFAFVDTEGKWSVEGEGVAPDQQVFDNPGELIAGKNPILEAGVAYLMAQLKAGVQNPRPQVPMGPKRN